MLVGGRYRRWFVLGGDERELDAQSTALARGNSYKLGPGTMLLRIRINERPPVHPTPKASSRTKGRKSKSLRPGGMGTESMIS